MSHRTPPSFILLVTVWLGLHHAGSASPGESPPASAVPPVEALGPRSAERPLRAVLDGRWAGRGIAYGPYRTGQRPGGPLPVREELTEDLLILSSHWDLIRLYGARDVTADVLQIIEQRKLPLRVMLGAWIASETAHDDAGNVTGSNTLAIAANHREIDSAVRLARQYSEHVLAVCVGNETQVFWSDHPVPADLLIRYIRQVREATTVPVTTADDFKYWELPESRVLAQEVDFIVTHVYAMWGGVVMDDAIRWTQEQFAKVRRMHPAKEVVLGEAGWATRVHTQGEQARLIKGVADEQQQLQFFRSFRRWTDCEQLTHFYFEAFDESWKGGSHPDEVEKHWGLFRVDRTAKAAMQDAVRTNR